MADVTEPTMLTQENQDRIWRHYQTDATGIFDLSDPRMRFLARRCAAGTRVLNIGVGSGKLEELLLRRGVEMYSLDPSDKTIELLRARLGMGDRARQGYGEKIPFDAAFFDRVIMTEVLEHLPDDTLHATLSEVQRVLRPGGDLIGTVPYREDLSANIVICPHCDGRFHRWGHHQRFDTPSLRALLQRHGFVIKRLYPRVFPDFRRAQPFQFLKSIIRYVLGLMGEPMAAPNLYFRAGNR